MAEANQGYTVRQEYSKAGTAKKEERQVTPNYLITNSLLFIAACVWKISFFHAFVMQNLSFCMLFSV